MPGYSLASKNVSAANHFPLFRSLQKSYLLYPATGLEWDLV